MTLPQRSVARLALALWVALACALARVPAARAQAGAGVAGLEDTLGRPLDRVTVQVVGKLPSGLRPPLTTVPLGNPLTQELLARALADLGDGGRFGVVAATLSREGGSAALSVEVAPRRRIARVQLKGDVLGRLRVMEAAGIAEGGPISEERLPEAKARIDALYARRGFPDAEVSVDLGATDDPAEAIVSIELSHRRGDARLPGPGGPLTISRRVFVLAPQLEAEVGDQKRDYRVEAGDRADEAALAEADQALRTALRLGGFFRAEVKHALLRRGRECFLYVYLETGPRIELAFDGNRAFDADQLRDALRPRERREPEAAQLADTLRRFYVERGFLDAEVSAEEVGAPDAPLHHLRLRIVEHGQVRVARRVFPCLSGELGPDAVGSEIQSFLEEELPGAQSFSLPDPRGIDALLGPTDGVGGRTAGVVLSPATTYAPDTYERALAHLRELFQSKGYLSAVIGPVTVVRATCDPRSPPGACVPDASFAVPTRPCPRDALGLPLPLTPLPEELTCHPDLAGKVACADELTLSIPIHPGPKTLLYDLAFEGSALLTPAELAERVELRLGDPLSNFALESARLAILDEHKRLGFPFAEVRAVVEPSPDRTRARARFVIAPGPRVRIRRIAIQGLARTDEDVVRGRLAIASGDFFRQDLVRLSEERIATLGPFSSVTIGLDEPDVQAEDKDVVVTVAEQLPQYLEPKIGFSTGDGLRFGFDYGHRTVAGRAISLGLSAQLNYLFDFMIIDPAVRRNYDQGDCKRRSDGTVTCSKLQVIDRLEGRGTASIGLPEIGLGPAIGLGVDAVFARDNQRDFGLTKRAIVPSLIYRPRRPVQVTVGASVELNDVQIFDAASVEEAILKRPALASLLRVPDGSTFAVAQRVGAVWDRRDTPLSAKTGTLVSGAIEHVNALPQSAGSSATDFTSHFLRASSRVAGYVKLTKRGTSVAMSFSTGYNLQLASDSKTYPDRLFFLGGVDSLRAFLADSVVPQDVADRLLRDAASTGKAPAIEGVAIRGGDVMLNPRFELRVPYSEALELGLFLDMGNLWVDPSEVDLLKMRYGAGAGLRFTTPIGPLALDYGINLDRRAWEDFGAFHFSIGLF